MVIAELVFDLFIYKIKDVFNRSYSLHGNLLN